MNLKVFSKGALEMYTGLKTFVTIPKYLGIEEGSIMGPLFFIICIMEKIH